MTKSEYYDAIKCLVPTEGEIPLEKKREIVQFMQKHPGINLSPATDKELGAILNYLNHTSKTVDFLSGNLGFTRYKDAVLCLNYEKTEWTLLERRPDDQLWDIWNYIQQYNDDPEFELSMSGVYGLR